MINLSETKGVTLNGIDIDVAYRAAIGEQLTDVPDKEWVLASRVSRKVSKMRRQGHTQERCHAFAKAEIIKEAQALSGPPRARLSPSRSRDRQ